MRRLALAAIRLYQKYISPHKGFCCAYRKHTGRASCSALGYRAVRRYGVLCGAQVIRSRTHLCGVVHRRQRSELPVRSLHAQRGVCDIGCDLPSCDLPCNPNCDLPSLKGVSGVCDFLSCCDCGSCDWPNKKRKQSKEEEQYVYIPPKAWRPKNSEQGRGDGPNPSIERTNNGGSSLRSFANAQPPLFASHLKR
jgi:putative component of membrane protein insertase Oxa1/YidC/SpoIIIJ protein YidD